MGIPEGWNEIKLGNVFASSKRKGISGLPTSSVTLNDGVVLRESLDRKTDTNLAPEKHLLVEEGDLAYNMMRMWQGASGKVHYSALVSPAYVVLKPKQNVDSDYAAYLFKSARMIYLFWAYSYGLTSDRLRLYFNDFALIKYFFPPLSEQKRIAEVLGTWDRAIAVTEELIAASEAQKKALMQQLLTGKRRLPGFEGEWREVKLGDVVSLWKGQQKGRAELTSDGPVPVINGGVSASGYTDLSNASAGTITISEGGNSCGFVAFQEEPFWCGGHCYALLKPKMEINFFFAQLKHFEREIMRLRVGSGLPNIQKKDLLKLKLWQPSPDEQKAIGELFSSCDEGLSHLQAKLQTLKTEKAALMQQLLTGKRRVKLTEAEV